MSNLDRSEFLMEHQGRRENGELVEEFVEPTPPDEDTTANRLSLDTDIWEHMGEPKVITVTLQPGDKLNDA